MSAAHRTKAEMAAFKAELYTIVEANRPCSVRQVYYVGIGWLWNKDTGGSRTVYNMVTRALGDMREAGELPWGWLADSTRYVRIDRMFDSVTQALDDTRAFYRRDLWSSQPRRVEVWAESDSTASLIDTVTRTLGVGLYSCRGQAGKEFAHAAAMIYLNVAKPVTILYVGDWDPSGLSIPRSVLERLRRYTGDTIDLDLRRLAVTADDVASGEFVGHPVNTADRNYRVFADHCKNLMLAPQTAVEVEAIPPPVLRQRTEDALYGLVDNDHNWNATLEAETSEREILARIAGAARPWPIDRTGGGAP